METAGKPEHQNDGQVNTGCDKFKFCICRKVGLGVFVFLAVIIADKLFWKGLMQVPKVQKVCSTVNTITACQCCKNNNCNKLIGNRHLDGETALRFIDQVS